MQPQKQEMIELCDSFIDFFQIVIVVEKQINNNTKREWEYFKNLLDGSSDISRIRSYIRVLKATSEEPSSQYSPQNQRRQRTQSDVRKDRSSEGIPQENKESCKEIVNNLLGFIKGNNPGLVALKLNAAEPTSIPSIPTNTPYHVRYRSSNNNKIQQINQMHSKLAIVKQVITQY